MRPPEAEVVALAQELVNRVREQQGRSPRAICLGCGDGRHVVALAETGVDVLALDRMPNAARSLAEVAPGTNFVLHDLAEPLPAPPVSFDAALLWSVLPHAAETLPATLLPNIGRLLRPRGVLLVNFLDPRDCRRGAELNTPWGALRFHRRSDIDPHVWWGRIAEARLVRAEIEGWGRSAEWRLRVEKPGA